MQPHDNSLKCFHWQKNERDLLGMLKCCIQVSIDIIGALVKVSFLECYHFLQPSRFMSFETFMSIHKISISLRVHNEQRSKTKLFTKGFNSFSCPNQLTKVSTFQCRKVNRNTKFDCEKSSLAFSIRLGKVVDQQCN